MARKRKKEKTPDNKRQIARRHLVFYLRVFDGTSNSMLGHLADISREGLKIVCDTPLEADRDYRLRMRLPKEVGGRTDIVMEAHCCWCREDANPDFYIAGFKLKDRDQELEANIGKLIEDFSMEESLQEDGSDRPACNLTHTTGR